MSRGLTVHCSYHSPHRPGSYNRALGRFLDSPAAEGHLGLFWNSNPGGDEPEHPRQVHLSGRLPNRLALKIQRIAGGLRGQSLSVHHDPERAAFARLVKRNLDELNPEVVIVYDDYRLAFQLGRAKSRRYALVLSQHGTTYNLPHRAERQLYSSATLDAVFLLNSQAKRLIDQMGEGAAWSRVVPNSVDTDFYAPIDSETGCRLRESMGIDSNQLVGLIAGRLVREKGVDRGMRAWYSATGVRGSTLLIAGDGDDAYTSELPELARDFGAQTSTRFLGQLTADEMRAVYQLSDLMVFPTRVPEGMPLVVLEALACGVPVASSPFAAVDDIRNPSLLEAADESLERLTEIVETAARLIGPEMRAQAREAIVVRFSLAQGYAELNEALRDVVAVRRQGSRMQ